MINVIQTYLRTQLFGRKLYQTFFFLQRIRSQASLSSRQLLTSPTYLLIPHPFAKARILWLQQCLDVHSDSVCLVVSGSGQTVPTD